MIDIDSEVLAQLEQGEWWLIRPEADFVEWLAPMRAFDPVVMALMKNPPGQPSRSPNLLRLIDKVTGKPLGQYPYKATVDASSVQRRTDPLGVAHLFVPADAKQISMKIIGR